MSRYSDLLRYYSPGYQDIAPVAGSSMAENTMNTYQVGSDVLEDSDDVEDVTDEVTETTDNNKVKKPKLSKPVNKSTDYEHIEGTVYFKPTITRKEFVVNNYDLFDKMYTPKEYDPTVHLAQAILEAGIHRSGGNITKDAVINGHVMFGVKTYKKGQKHINTNTHEDSDEKGVHGIKDNFNVYDTFLDSIKGHIRFFDENNRYRKMQASDNLGDYMNYLKKSGYATDRFYLSKLSLVMVKDVLPNIPKNVKVQKVKELIEGVVPQIRNDKGVQVKDKDYNYLDWCYKYLKTTLIPKLPKEVQQDLFNKLEAAYAEALENAKKEAQARNKNKKK